THHREPGHRGAEDRGAPGRPQVEWVGEHDLVVLEPDEGLQETEGVWQEKRVIDGLAGGPEEEDEGDGHLGRQEHVRQQPVAEDHAPVHRVSMRPARVPVIISERLSRSKFRRTTFPRWTALSSACWALCC